MQYLEMADSTHLDPWRAVICPVVFGVVCVVRLQVAVRKFCVSIRLVVSNMEGAKNKSS